MIEKDLIIYHIMKASDMIMKIKTPGHSEEQYGEWEDKMEYHSDIAEILSDQLGNIGKHGYETKF